MNIDPPVFTICEVAEVFGENSQTMMMETTK